MESIESKLNEILINQLAMRNDINNIKRELMGNEEYGNYGYKDRLEIVENKVRNVENITNKRMWTERGIYVGFTAVWTIILKFWDKLFS